MRQKKCYSAGIVKYLHTKIIKSYANIDRY